MSSRKDIRPEATVKARMHQLESAVASADHLSKHPDQLRKRQQRKVYFDADSDDDDGTSDFAELLKNLTLGAAESRSSKKDALREAFKILDCDEDGFITLSDLRQAMQDFDDDDDDDNDDDDEDKLTDEDLLEMLVAADSKGNGKISFEDFVRVVEPKTKNQTKHETESKR